MREHAARRSVENWGPALRCPMCGRVGLLEESQDITQDALRLSDQACTTIQKIHQMPVHLMRICKCREVPARSNNSAFVLFGDVSTSPRL